MSIAKNRRLNRLKGYNYSQDGWYFVTLCVKNCENSLGNIANGKMRLSEIGKIAQKYWLEIPQHFPNAKLDEFIVMPNHLHGIIGIENNIAGNKNVGNENVGNNNHCSLPSWQKQWALSLSSIIRGFKIGVTKWRRQNNDQSFAWQKSFYDHIIQDEKSLYNIREYIRGNPLKWKTDRNNLENLLSLGLSRFPIF